jgi:transposase InsO family protein
VNWNLARRVNLSQPDGQARVDGPGFLIVPNLLHGLVPSGLDQIWVADITYIRLREAFAYLAVILDGFSRKVVGWALAPHLDASLAVAALDHALADRKPRPASLIHHSDRGVQYASTDYRQRLAGHDITVSMSRPGNPYDNAKAESFPQDRRGRRPSLQEHRARKTFHRRLHRYHLQHRAPPLRPRLLPAT